MYTMITITQYQIVDSREILEESPTRIDGNKR
jgi:hypothetical protein